MRINYKNIGLIAVAYHKKLDFMKKSIGYVYILQFREGTKASLAKYNHLDFLCILRIKCIYKICIRCIS